jgi:hypothetical protein
MADEEDIRAEILSILRGKSVMKQKIYDNTLDVLNLIKPVLNEISREYNTKLKDVDRRVNLDYKDRGQFEAQLKVAGDMLIFSMHTNIFEFNREHSIWKIPYVLDNKINSYCGVISIYNFLSDSFKYFRDEDLGYLVARIFINIENHFFVEGKRQFGFLYNNFGKDVITKETLRQILYNTIQYTLDFDLLVPPYDNVKIVSVGQMNQKIEYSRMQTGKRLGFTYNSDDIAPKDQSRRSTI